MAGKAEKVSDAQLKGNIINLLNAENNSFIFPRNNENNGYPVIRSIYYRDLFEGKYEVKNLRIEGKAVLGTNLEAKFDTKGEQAAIDCIEYQWLKADNADGAFTKIDGEIKKTITVAKELNDSYIKVILYLPTGEELESEAFYLNVFDTSFNGTISDLEVRGILKAGNTLFFRYNSNDVKDENIFNVTWLMASQEDGNYEEVGEGESYTTEDVETVKYYKVKLTLVNGKEYISPAISVDGHAKIKHTAVDGENVKFDTVNTTTPPENVFTVGNQEFILLDTIQSSDSGRFLVLAKSSASIYGSSSIDEIDSDKLLELLPAELANYIEKTTYWHSGVNAWSQYRNYGKHSVYIPSIEEVKKYSDKIGLADENVNWWTRSNSNLTSNGNLTISVDTQNVGTTTNVISSNSQAIRPIFYLGVDFFKNVKLDIDLTGPNVLSAVRDNYTKKELLTLYTKKELEEKFGFDTDVSIVTGEVVGDLSSEAFSVKLEVKSNIDNANIKAIAAVYDENGSLYLVNNETGDVISDRESM